MGEEGERTFFVESYVPRLDDATAKVLSSRLRAAVKELRREGRSLRWHGSFALIDEETFVWMLAGLERELVTQVSERAGVGYYHVAEVAVDPSRV
jgi:hypothetical protein